MRFFKRKALSLFLVFSLVPLCFNHNAASDSPYQSVFRLHIIANSNSTEDQQVKLLVRDALLEYEAQHMRGATDKQDAKQSLMADGEALLSIVENALHQNGFSYGAQLCVGTFPFPERSYSGKTYPAGDYEALRVVLGNGEGNNWWCVMFPPLCILELSNGEIDVEELQLDSLLLKLIKEADGGKLWKKIIDLLPTSLR
ncbi:MAG TPA: stage II sporulation protein R [Clostridia bacterium]|nr:stage II sporulation protein R [Clostridia bacterium]